MCIKEGSDELSDNDDNEKQQCEDCSESSVDSDSVHTEQATLTSSYILSLSAGLYDQNEYMILHIIL